MKGAIMTRVRQFFILATVAICTTYGSHSFAADGSSGCGPGWYVFNENSLVSSSLRATTNGLLFPVVTIGMTFGTSNCTKHKIVLKEKESLHFATMNYYELQAEVAKGSGQYLSAFATTMGCNPSAQPRLIQHLKNNYQEIFQTGSPNPEKALEGVYKTIFRDRELTNKCSLDIA
jgi:hypothetical protein